MFVVCDLHAQLISDIHFTGKINNKYSVEVDLSFDSAGEVKGIYRYAGKNRFIDLSGKARSDGSIVLAESLDGNTGYWNGIMFSNDSIAGTWTSGDKKRTYPFYLVNKTDGNGLSLVYSGAEAKKWYYISNDSLWSSAHELNLHLKKDAPDTLYNGSVEVSGRFAFMTGGDQLVRDRINRTLMNDYFDVEVGTSLPPLFDSRFISDCARKHIDSIASWEVTFDHNDDGSVNIAPVDANETYQADVKWNCGGLICIEVLREAFYGGHDELSRHTYCFDCHTGAIITLDNLFVHGYQAPLKELTLKETQSSVETDHALCVLDSDTLIPVGNFCLTTNGCQFYFHHYWSIDCEYSEAELEWSQIEKWIDPKGPLGWMKN
jgi:hypothetical protein